MSQVPEKEKAIRRSRFMSGLEQFSRGLVGGELRVEWGADAPHADVEKRIIRLPSPPEKIDENTAVLTRAFVDHECAHIIYTEAGCLDGLGHEQRLLLNAIEDGRINRLLGERFPGCGTNIERALRRSRVPGHFCSPKQGHTWNSCIEQRGARHEDRRQVVAGVGKPEGGVGGGGGG